MSSTALHVIIIIHKINWKKRSEEVIVCMYTHVGMCRVPQTTRQCGTRSFPFLHTVNRLRVFSFSLLLLVILHSYPLHQTHISRFFSFFFCFSLHFVDIVNVLQSTTSSIQLLFSTIQYSVFTYRMCLGKMFVHRRSVRNDAFPNADQIIIK